MDLPVSNSKQARGTKDANKKTNIYYTINHCLTYIDMSTLIRMQQTLINDPYWKDYFVYLLPLSLWDLHVIIRKNCSFGFVNIQTCNSTVIFCNNYTAFLITIVDCWIKQTIYGLRLSRHSSVHWVDKNRFTPLLYLKGSIWSSSLVFRDLRYIYIHVKKNAVLNLKLSGRKSCLEV